ncbi:MAG: M20/M25/M40 family metallo-hydrolase, partial [Propionivibrio sp.]|nr:M20/M25/M40 family metallo-hydrolase [Propionivibrio sp.]
SRQEGRLAAYLRLELEALGFVVEFDSAGEQAGGDTGNLIATLSGDPDIEPIVLSCHMDTVTPCIGVTPIIEDGVIRSDGTTVLGGDDKAGIAAILEGVRRIRERSVRHGLVQAVFTICEEVGMYGAMGLDYSKIKAKRAFILDADGPIGQILVRGPAKDAIHAAIHGRSAHAGLKPEAGISAIQVAARAIDRMKLLRIDDETTANLGQIAGGGATNIVTDRVEITAEARSLTNDKLDAQCAHMKACFEDAAREFGATAEVTIERSYYAFSLDADEPVVRHCAAAMRNLGLTPKLASTGGGSDCNVFNRHGMKAVDLSIGMTDVHTCKESLRIDDLEMTARLVEALIEFDDRAVSIQRLE